MDVIFTATPQGFLAGLLTEEILSSGKDCRSCPQITGLRMWRFTKSGTSIEHKIASVYPGSCLWTLRNQQRPDYEGYKTCGESGLLYNLLDFNCLSACQRKG